MTGKPLDPPPPPPPPQALKGEVVLTYDPEPTPEAADGKGEAKEEVAKAEVKVEEYEGGGRRGREGGDRPGRHIAGGGGRGAPR
ncbi:hypothetical protein THAOC_00860, partial [Thalassiosira oceanica]